PLRVLATKTVLPSGVTASPVGLSPTMMSVGFLVLVFTSIVDTVSLPLLATNAVARHRRRVASVDAPVGTPPTSAPANPNTTTPPPTPTPTPPPRHHCPFLAVLTGFHWADQAAYAAGLANRRHRTRHPGCRINREDGGAHFDTCSVAPPALFGLYGGRWLGVRVAG